MTRIVHSVTTISKKLCRDEEGFEGGECDVFLPLQKGADLEDKE